MSNSSIKRKAFTNGVIGFYTGKMQSVTYSKSAGELTAKAWNMTGKSSMKEALKQYESER